MYPKAILTDNYCLTASPQALPKACLYKDTKWLVSVKHYCEISLSLLSSCYVYWDSFKWQWGNLGTF